MSTTIYPIDLAVARKAARWQKKGLLGKAISEKLKLGVSADQANVLANVGRAVEAEEQARLSENEQAVLLALAALERANRNRGITSSPKAWMLCRQTRLSEGQIRRLTKRLNQRGYETEGLFGFVSHSRNGHIWMLPAGWAVVHALEASTTETRSASA